MARDFVTIRNWIDVHAGFGELRGEAAIMGVPQKGAGANQGQISRRFQCVSQFREPIGDLPAVFEFAPRHLQADFGNRFDVQRPIRARRNSKAVARQPKPYLTLRRKLIEEASWK